MRKKNTQKIDDVIQEYLKALKIDDKLKEVKLIKSWDEVVGKTIARSTNELFMLREGLKKALNDKVGEEVIDEIILK